MFVYLVTVLEYRILIGDFKDVGERQVLKVRINSVNLKDLVSIPLKNLPTDDSSTIRGMDGQRAA